MAKIIDRYIQGLTVVSHGWFCLKLVKVIIISTCIILLPITQAIYGIDSSFLNATKTPTTQSPSTKPPIRVEETTRPFSTTGKQEERQNTSRVQPSTTASQPNETDSVGTTEKPELNTTTKNQNVTLRFLFPGITRDSADAREHSDEEVKLSYLLVLYPCCNSLILLLGMETCSYVMRDPINLVAMNVIMVFVFAVGITLSVVSLIASLDTLNPLMIAISTLGFIFIFLQIVDCGLLWRRRRVNQ